ncbi:MAG: hypothetical protein KC635_01535 [Myxococcales bacterium]|nr:hypothetical protein [Myxococcales bacterium]
MLARPLLGALALLLLLAPGVATAAPADPGATFAVSLQVAGPIAGVPREGLVILPIRGPLDRVPPVVTVTDAGGADVAGASRLEHLGVDELWLAWQADEPLAAEASYTASVSLPEAAAAEGSTLAGPLTIPFTTRADLLDPLRQPVLVGARLETHAAACSPENEYVDFDLTVQLTTDADRFRYLRVDQWAVTDGVADAIVTRYPPYPIATTTQVYPYDFPPSGERCAWLRVEDLVTGAVHELERCVDAADEASAAAGPPAVGCDFVAAGGDADDGGCAGSGAPGGWLALAMLALGLALTPRRRRHARPNHSNWLL